MKIFKLTAQRLQRIEPKNIPMEFISNLREGNQEVKELLPEINKIDKKLGEFCEMIIRRFKG